MCEGCDVVSVMWAAHSETLTSGYNLKLTARVALLTRNIVIEGGSYPDLVKESFGARIIVGRAVYNGVSRNGEQTLCQSFVKYLCSELCSFCNSTTTTTTTTIHPPQKKKKRGKKKVHSEASCLGALQK